MIQYKIQCKNPVSQFIEIELKLNFNETERVKLQLPAWRAGRYQLANYAQNIRSLSVLDSLGNSLLVEKTSKDCWEFNSNQEGPYRICYEYFCGKMDAGSSWVDDEQVYLNLVNCCFDVVGKSEEEVEVILDLPQFPKQISTLIPIFDSVWKANGFQMLADSTILASKILTHYSYSIGETQFHIWIHGEIHFDQSQFSDHFEVFSSKLIQDFGEFPEPEYHFIFQLLPYPHFHGVEHRRGTVITFGPAESLSEPEQMEELLGVSCHELYHAWNVCRIRPKELLPYDFSKETYTKAGLLLEGVTTYMGDLYLLKSGVYDLPTYFKHLEKVLARESASFGWQNHTIAQSSFDLWLDGYVAGIPDRKVNIYTHGALLALCIDVFLLKNEHSAGLIMKEMWKRFGKPFEGYNMEDFENLVLEKFLDKTEIHAFFLDFVHGKENLFPFLKSQLSSIGIDMKETLTEDGLLHQFGIRTNAEGVILQLHPESKAYFSLMRNDQILNWTNEKSSNSAEVKIQIKRNGRALEISLAEEKRCFFPVLNLSMRAINPLTEKWKA
ncbi:M61 family peptidase [Algoriphagus sp.]|uniref:M61 family metallopeptidase n=1 Tax=Algoriphagus sp. TaxID=1872435 RepID=UPI0039195C6F